MSDFETDLKTKIALETARIDWKELQPWFAKGHVIVVSAELDLVSVAFELCQDNKQQFEAWMQSEQISNATDEQAKLWLEEDKELWAVVVKPWILVQDKPLPTQQ